MRFDSLQGLLQLLAVLNTLGYSSRPLDYQEDMEKHGMKEHISRYTCKIAMDYGSLNKDSSVLLKFSYYGKVIYTIECDKEER